MSRLFRSMAHKSVKRSMSPERQLCCDPEEEEETNNKNNDTSTNSYNMHASLLNLTASSAEATTLLSLAASKSRNGGSSSDYSLNQDEHGQAAWTCVCGQSFPHFNSLTHHQRSAGCSESLDLDSEDPIDITGLRDTAFSSNTRSPSPRSRSASSSSPRSQGAVCPSCSQVFASIQHLQYHVEESHSASMYASEAFPSSSLLKGEGDSDAPPIS